MRFDDAFAILVEHCIQISQALSNAHGHHGNSARNASYGNDVWIASVVRSHWASKTDPNSLMDTHYLPFYDAAWELCRIGVLRPGPHAPMGQGQIGGGIYSGDGYSITEFGSGWLSNPDRRISADPSRIAEIFATFSDRYGQGYAQRAIEAVRCHRMGNYLATCVMAGAAAESILLAVAVAKVGDEAKVLKDYASAGGRGRTTKMIVGGQQASALGRTFEAALQVLHYWRDDAAHGVATTIQEVEAYASLTQLLRLAQLCADRWQELTKQV